MLTMNTSVPGKPATVTVVTVETEAAAVPNRLSAGEGDHQVTTSVASPRHVSAFQSNAEYWKNKTICGDIES